MAKIIIVSYGFLCLSTLVTLAIAGVETEESIATLCSNGFLFYVCNTKKKKGLGTHQVDHNAKESYTSTPDIISTRAIARGKHGSNFHGRIMPTGKELECLRSLLKNML